MWGLLKHVLILFLLFALSFLIKDRPFLVSKYEITFVTKKLVFSLAIIMTIIRMTNRSTQTNSFLSFVKKMYYEFFFFKKRNETERKHRQVIAIPFFFVFGKKTTRDKLNSSINTMILTIIILLDMIFDWLNYKLRINYTRFFPSSVFFSSSQFINTLFIYLLGHFCLFNRYFIINTLHSSIIIIMIIIIILVSTHFTIYIAFLFFGNIVIESPF